MRPKTRQKQKQNKEAIIVVSNNKIKEDVGNINANLNSSSLSSFPNNKICCQRRCPFDFVFFLIIEDLVLFSTFEVIGSKGVS